MCAQAAARGAAVRDFLVASVRREYEDIIDDIEGSLSGGWSALWAHHGSRLAPPDLTKVPAASFGGALRAPRAPPAPATHSTGVNGDEYDSSGSRGGGGGASRNTGDGGAAAAAPALAAATAPSPPASPGSPDGASSDSPPRDEGVEDGGGSKGDALSAVDHASGGAAAASPEHVTADVEVPIPHDPAGPGAAASEPAEPPEQHSREPGGEAEAAPTTPEPARAASPEPGGSALQTPRSAEVRSSTVVTRIISSVPAAEEDAVAAARATFGGDGPDACVAGLESADGDVVEALERVNVDALDAATRDIAERKQLASLAGLRLC